MKKQLQNNFLVILNIYMSCCTLQIGITRVKFIMSTTHSELQTRLQFSWFKCGYEYLNFTVIARQMTFVVGAVIVQLRMHSCVNDLIDSMHVLHITMALKWSYRKYYLYICTIVIICMRYISCYSYRTQTIYINKAY